MAPNSKSQSSAVLHNTTMERESCQASQTQLSDTLNAGTSHHDGVDDDWEIITCADIEKSMLESALSVTYDGPSHPKHVLDGMKLAAAKLTKGCIGGISVLLTSTANGLLQGIHPKGNLFHTPGGSLLGLNIGIGRGVLKGSAIAIGTS